MPNPTLIAKWGNSLAVRIPASIAGQANLSAGDAVEVSIADGGAIILRASRPRYSLDELVSKITPQNRHAEVDWGKPVGKEIW